MRTMIILCALALTGCASDYRLYADASAKSEIARHNADAAKYRAMADIAAQGDASAKVAAVMAIALGQQSTAQAQQLRPPEHATGTLLQWAQVLVNPLTQMYGAYSARRVGESQASYSFQGLKSTNDTFGLIASKIQAPATPAPNVTTTTNTTTTDRHDVTTSMTNSTGVLGSGTYNPVTTTTPAPVVITPVVQVVPTVITPVAPSPAPIVPVVITPVVQVVPIVPTP